MSSMGDVNVVLFPMIKDNLNCQAVINLVYNLLRKDKNHVQGTLIHDSEFYSWRLEHTAKGPDLIIGTFEEMAV